MLRSSTPNKKNRYSLGQALALSTIILVPSMLFLLFSGRLFYNGDAQDDRGRGDEEEEDADMEDTNNRNDNGDNNGFSIIIPENAAWRINS
jgi:hypothetical protein